MVEGTHTNPANINTMFREVMVLQACQDSHILCETHAFTCHLTLTRMHIQISRICTTHVTDNFYGAFLVPKLGRPYTNCDEAGQECYEVAQKYYEAGHKCYEVGQK